MGGDRGGEEGQGGVIALCQLLFSGKADDDAGAGREPERILHRERLHGEHDPSLFEADYTAEKEIQFILEHQMGHAPQKIYLRVYTENSKWHVLARIAIRRI